MSSAQARGRTGRGLGLGALLVATALVAGPLSSQEAEARRTGADLPVVEHTLDNGMRLLVLPRDGAPTVSLVVHFGVGGMHERPGQTGIAHLLEHLLFKGSTRIGTTNHAAEVPLFRAMDRLHDSLVVELDSPAPDSARLARLRGEISALEDSARTFVVPNELDRTLSRWGARGLNATTTNEATIYFVDLPANRLEHWFALEAERMTDPVFREFHTERDVVVEERRLRVDTSPGGLLYEAHLDAAWERNPYRQPVVGTMRDLQRIRREEVADYYDRFYGARNAVVAVVGAVDADRVIELAERWFGDVRPGEPITEPVFDEPAREEPIHVEVEWDAEPSLRIGWPIPAGDHPDTPALTLLSTLLTGGRTSVLYSGMVQESRTVTSIVSSIGPGERFPRLFTLATSPRAPHTPEEIESEILARVEGVVREGIDPQALERVRNQLAAGAVRRLRSNLGLAFQLAGSTASFGSWRETFDFAERMQAVTAEDVRAVAERWLRPERRVVATLRRGEAEEGR